MKNTIYWNHLWLNVTEFGGKKSSLSDDIKVKFYDLIEFAITNKDEPFIVTEDLEREYELQISKRVEKLYSEAEKVSRYRRDFFGNKHNLYEYNQEFVIELNGTVGKSEYMFLVLLYLSFNSKSIPNIESWFETHNSILGYATNDATKFKEVLNALLNYKALFSDDLYKGIVRQLGGGHLLDNDVYNTNIQIEQNNLALIQNNKIEVTKEFHTYNETVHNFHPAQEKIVEVKYFNLNEYIPLNKEWLFMKSLNKLRELSFIGDENKWLLKPLDLVAYFGIIRSLGWCVSIGKNEVKTKAEFGEFLSEYFCVSNKTLQGYMKDDAIDNAIVKKGKQFESVFNQHKWGTLKHKYPSMFK